MADFRKESAEGKELKSSKARTKLPDELLAGVQGAGWHAATTVLGTEANDNTFFDVWVIWRFPGDPDRMCTVESFTKTNNVYTSFDLYCPAEGYIYYDVPADQVLVDCID